MALRHSAPEMSLESPKIDYQCPPAHAERWQLRRVIDWLTAGCFAAAVSCGFMSYVLARKLATPTPAYQQFVQAVRAQAATRPAGTALHYPPFSGQAYIPRPLLSLPTTYFAVAFGGASVGLFVMSARRSGGAG
jgi:hypothetical protein